MDDLDALRQFATTDRQLEILDAVIREGGQRAAGRALNIGAPAVDQVMWKLKRRAAIHGYSPQHDMTKTVPEPFIVRGVSTYYNKEGKASGQWVKSRLDDAKYQEIINQVLEGLKEDIPRAAPISPSSGMLNEQLSDQLLNCYVITDYHMGMLSWKPETGADWDLDKAEELVVKWFRQAINQSPWASHCVFAQLSDFLHFDGMDAVTPASKHLLDVDTRFAKVVKTAIRVLRQIITMLLEKHNHVHIIMADANHDPVSQIWLREWFAVFYEEEPRVTVDTSPSPYNAFEFGKTALYFHHGHKRKVSNVSEVFAAQFREMFGRTKHAYAHMGHLHHLDIKENNLMIVEQHRTLAPADAYAARGGWLTGRDAKCITYHKEYGEVSRLTINSDMLK